MTDSLVPPVLAPDYVEARRRFRAAAEAAGASMRTIGHPDATGRQHEELTIDLATLGPIDATHRVLVVSGTHGVEGYCGSALQTHWLTAHSGSRPDDVRVVMLHALNPFGFSWVRRVNEDNVDLNRNFIDFDGDLPHNGAYDRIAELLVPQRWDEDAQAESTMSLLAFVEEVGMEQMQEAVSSGQYADPVGLFYGGTKPSWSQRQLETIWADELWGATTAAVLDLHTGLGPWAHGELICHEHSGSAGYQRAASRWGDVRSMLDGESVSAALSGDWLGTIHRWAGATTVDAVSIEYGTVDEITVLQALRADAWLHGRGDPAAPEAAVTRRQVWEAFLDDDPSWVTTCNEQFVRHMVAALR